MHLEVKLVLTLTFMATMVYWQLSPVFPEFLKEKKIKSDLTGYCLAIYPAFFLISAILTGKYLLRYFDRVNACFIGALFLVVYLIGLGLL